jgi:DNA adenine methylase
MFSNKLYTPLRYPGGKARFAPFISSIMEANGLCGVDYLEPFAGGAGVALELLFHGYAETIHINDLDPAVYAFWAAVTQEPEGVLRLLRETSVNMEQWFYWRAILRGERDATLCERGFATLFMNRTNRSGILKGGVVGGIEQTGPYKLNARYDPDALSKRVERIARHASQIHVYCEDALSLLRRSKLFLRAGSLVYLDPPYYIKGQGLYRNYYKHSDHTAIADLIRSPDFPFPWVVSYDNAAEIREMYEYARRLTYGLHYSAQERYVGHEVMFFAPGLRIPRKFAPAIPKAA